MRHLTMLAYIGLAVLAAGCAADERRWMKTGATNNTREDFRRDVEACTVSGGKLDEACMRDRGWVSVAAPQRGPTSQPAVRQGPGMAIPSGSGTGRY